MRLAALVFLAGCWTGSSTEPVPPKQPDQPMQPQLDCGTVVAHAMDISREELDRTIKPAQIEDVRQAAISSCRETSWSQELLACFAKTKTSQDLEKCESTVMTKDQSTDLNVRVNEAVQQGKDDPCAP